MADERAAARLSGTRSSSCSRRARFVTGNESALVNALSGGEAKPTFGAQAVRAGGQPPPDLGPERRDAGASGFDCPPRGGLVPGDRNRRRPRLHAGLALGRGLGSRRLRDRARALPWPSCSRARGADDELAAVLIGGYFGSWLPASAVARALLSPAELAQRGASLGAGVIVPLGLDACPVAETARVADYLAGESAGQCGPCVNGLGAIADTLQQVASGTAPSSAGRDLARWSGVAGRSWRLPVTRRRHPVRVKRAAGVRGGVRRSPPARTLRRLPPRARAPRRRLAMRSAIAMKLVVNPIQCVAHGMCAELLPERVTLDEWGYPIIDGEPIPAGLEETPGGRPTPARRWPWCCSNPPAVAADRAAPPCARGRVVRARRSGAGGLRRQWRIRDRSREFAGDALVGLVGPSARRRAQPASVTARPQLPPSAARPPRPIRSSRQPPPRPAPRTSCPRSGGTGRPRPGWLAALAWR